MSLVLIEKAEFDDLKRSVESLHTMLRDIKREVCRDTKLYNITETAEMLGITRQTLHAYIRYGQVETVLVGNKHFFTRDLINKIQQR